METPEPGEWPPQEFGEYRLVRLLGRGAMGEVYLAHDQVLDRAVAIKFITTLEADVRERFLIEARAAARIQHPNVMAIHRVGEITGRPYLISEFVRGQNLAELTLPMPPARALELGIGLARGLAAAHRQGVLHRDIKLANVMVNDQGEVKLLDFSLAKLEDAVPHLEHLQQAAQRSKLGQPLISPLDATAPVARAFSPPLDVAGPTPAIHREFDAGWRSPTASLTEDGALIGTPHYMAPELWRAEPASRRSDIYALGVLLHILCAGSPPTEARDAAQLAVRVQQREPRPLAERVAGMDPRLAAIIDRCLRRDPDERFASGEELRVALEALDPVARPAPGGERAASVGNPYRGLRAFEAEHREVFFGRSREIHTVVDRLRAQSFLLVAGDSGVGKSSLCRAGVLPLISEGVLDPSRTWFAASITPGRRPVHALVGALAAGVDLDEDDLLAQVRVEPGALARILRRQQAGTRGQVVFVDQLEELVTLAPPAEAALAARLLVQLAAGVVGVRLLATARGDFLTRLAQLPGLQDELVRALYFLPPLAPEGVREAIVGPAEVRRVRFESEAMVDQLVTAGIEGSLPLLQFALAEIWEARDRTDDRITVAALDRLGGVSGALARHADGVIARLTLPERRAARALLMRLVTLEMTRASLTREELVGDDESARAAHEALVAGRLLVVRELPEGFAYEIAHEALIAGWTSLRVWLEEEAETRALRHRLEAAAADWDRLARPPEALWNERQLAELHVIDATSLRPREAAFAAAGARRLRRRRLLRVLVLAAVPVLLGGILGGVRLAQHSALRDEVDAHVAVVHAVMGRAGTHAGELERQRAVAFARFDAGDTVLGEAAWETARTTEAELEELYGQAMRELETAARRDADRADVRALLGDVIEARALLAERRHDRIQVEEFLPRLRLFDEDGTRLARWHAPGTLAIESSPAGARVLLERYERHRDGRIEAGPASELGVTPLADVAVPPGSYRLTFAAPGHAQVRYPLVVRRGEARPIEVALPTSSALPADFVYVPAGRSLYGSAGDEDLRRGFYGAVPMHEVHTDAYVIAVHETTYAEWIAFLDALPAEQRAQRTPQADAAAFQQAPGLQRLDDGVWQIAVMVGAQRQVVRAGERLTRTARSTRVTQDWLRLPVTGIRWEDGQAYMDWLDRTGRVPGARYCTEFEWERAARGADGRPFPNGERIGADEANFDETYAREVAAMAPDEVGSFPMSASPMGLHDAMGNVYELAAPPRSSGEKVARGGAYFFGALSGRAMNRNVIGPDFRDGTLGLRVCAAPRN